MCLAESLVIVEGSFGSACLGFFHLKKHRRYMEMSMVNTWKERKNNLLKM